MNPDPFDTLARELREGRIRASEERPREHFERLPHWIPLAIYPGGLLLLIPFAAVLWIAERCA